MQSIRTRYIGPTSTKPSRLQAKCAAKTLYVSYDHSLDGADNHKAACKAMLEVMDWITKDYPAVYGGTFENDMYWVFTAEWLCTRNTK
jgi:hypothetical protein